MSYCRWSTNDFQCDLYVYEDVGGFWSINVAGNRLVFHEPLPEPIELTEENAELWVERYRTVMARLEDDTTHHREPINLPHAGAHFRANTPTEAVTILEDLATIGYNFPPEVLEELREEAANV